jgi:hypothetical protein
MGLPPTDDVRPVRAGLLVALFILSFALRLGSMAAMTGLGAAPSPGSDEAEYDLCAWNLVQGNGYVGPSPDVVDAEGKSLPHPTAYRPPTSVLYYAAVYAVAGHSYLAAQVVNSAVAGLTVLLVFSISRHLFGRRTAWVAAILYACYPIALYYNLTLQSESLAAFLICLFVWLCLPFRDARGGWWAVGAGLGFGLLLLCKPGYLFLLPLLPFWAVAVCRGDRRLWFRAALIPIVAGLVIVPWAVRNYLELGKFIPFGTGGGSLLLQANNRIVVDDARYHGYAVWDISLPEYAPALREPNDEIERDAVAKKFAVDWLKKNPDKWFYLARGKCWRLWAPWYFGSGNRTVALGVCIYYGLILAGFLCAVIPVTARFIRERNPALMMTALILATVAMAVVFHGQHRYRFPIDSLCTVFAAPAFNYMAGSLRGTHSRGVGHRGWTRCMIGAGIAVGLAAAVAAATYYDEKRIHEYRLGVARQRLESMAKAVQEYQRDHRKAPDSLEDLVPEYLPMVEALHCPTHTLEYHEYQALESRDARAASQVISYRLEPPSAPGGPLRIVQIRGTPLIETYAVGP